VSNDANNSASLPGDAPEDQNVAGPPPVAAVPEAAPAQADPAEAATASAAEGSGAPEAAPPLEPAAAVGDPAADQPASRESAAEEPVAADEEEDDEDLEAEPLELIDEAIADEDIVKDWYILKVQVNREESIRDALQRRVKIAGLDRYFGDIVVPTEDIAEFSKSGKRRIVKRKLYPGYIMVHMSINDDTWFLVRETPGIGDFTGSAGKPTPMERREVERILSLGATEDSGDAHVKTAIPFHAGDRVRVKEGYFQNFEGDVESVDEANGRVTVMINIFGRSTPVELEHWQIEAV